MQNPTTKNELLATIQTDYQRLVDQVQRYSLAEQQMPGVNGEWAIKDLLTHFQMSPLSNRFVPGSHGKFQTVQPYDLSAD